MEGMLLALEPRRVPVDTLNVRLAVLLERKSKAGGMKGLERRLVRLQAPPAAKQEVATEKKV